MQRSRIEQLDSRSDTSLERCRRSRAWWRRRRALATTFCCAHPATIEVGQTTSRSLASGHRPPGHALRGSGTDAHPAGSTLGALRPPVVAGQVLRSDCRARAAARICCEATYRRRASPRSATRIASVAWTTASRGTACREAAARPASRRVERCCGRRSHVCKLQRRQRLGVGAPDGRWSAERLWWRTGRAAPLRSRASRHCCGADWLHAAPFVRPIM